MQTNTASNARHHSDALICAIMPIVLTRIDNRLVHGQILSSWLPKLQADTLVVLDDEAAQNTLVRSAMEIAIPPDLRLEIAAVAQAGEVLDALPPQARTLVLLRDVDDATRAFDAGAPFRQLNLGNIHHAHDRHSVTPSVYLSDDEFEALDKLSSRGVEIELRTLPDDQPLSLADVGQRLQSELR